MADEFYKVIPLDVGILSLGKDHVISDEYTKEDRIQFAIISFLIQGNGKNVLVDLGPKTLGYCNDMFQRFGFFRKMEDGSTPDDIVQKSGNVLDQLAGLGLKPEDITDVIFTHLHADHHGMDDAKDGGACEDFPNAVFHISKTGWDSNIEKRVDNHWNSYVDWGFGDCMMRKMEEGKMVARDNERIAPGLNTIYLGGHAVCSQAIRVETEQGVVIIGSDDFYQYNLMESGTIARLFTTRDRLIEVDGMLADWALSGAVIVPVHDPFVHELYANYGDNWLKEAGLFGYKAARGFRDRWPKRSC